MIALGVAERTNEDTHEPNNIQAQATILDSDLVANLYCYGYSIRDTFLEDIDWYKVNIPPKKNANITVLYTNATNTGWFWLQVPYLPKTAIEHSVAFQVRNDDIIQKYVSFAIVPNHDHFLNSSGTGGSIQGYQIYLDSIE